MIFKSYFFRFRNLVLFVLLFLFPFFVFLILIGLPSHFVASIFASRSEVWFIVQFGEIVGLISNLLFSHRWVNTTLHVLKMKFSVKGLRKSGRDPVHFLARMIFCVLITFHPVLTLKCGYNKTVPRNNYKTDERKTIGAAESRWGTNQRSCGIHSHSKHLIRAVAAIYWTMNDCCVRSIVFRLSFHTSELNIPKRIYDGVYCFLLSAHSHICIWAASEPVIIVAIAPCNLTSATQS